MASANPLSAYQSMRIRQEAERRWAIAERAILLADPNIPKIQKNDLAMEQIFDLLTPHYRHQQHTP